MEPNRIRCRVRERRSPECIGFWDEVDLCLGVIEQTNATQRERERERERGWGGGEKETIRKASTTTYQNIKN